MGKTEVFRLNENSNDAFNYINSITKRVSTILRCILNIFPKQLYQHTFAAPKTIKVYKASFNLFAGCTGCCQDATLKTDQAHHHHHYTAKLKGKTLLL